MQSIVLVSSFETQNWKFFLNHHGIPFQEIDYWEDQRELFATQCSNIILDHNTLNDLYHHQQAHLENILSRNKIFFVSFCDSPVIFRDNKFILEKIDQLNDASNLTCVLECDQFDHGLDNVKIDFDLRSKFFDLSEQRVSLRLEKNYSKDFLLCMGRSSPARDRLWTNTKELQIGDSIMVYHGTNPSNSNQWSNYIGENSAPLLWQRSLVPSLDLYNACCFEIVAETFSEQVCWFTEKIIRPIAARTPFIALGAPGLLRSLQKLGFKTYGSLIDESYDQETNLNTRIGKIVDTVDCIIKNRSKEFAQAARHITDYNWNRLAEIKGSFILDKDRHYLDLLSGD